MRRIAAIFGLLLVLVLTGAASAATVSSDQGSHSEAPLSGIVRDYHTVRKIALALTALGFFIALTRLTLTEMPHDKARALNVAVRLVILFLAIAGDRLIARGISSWFGLPYSALPHFWQ